MAVAVLEVIQRNALFHTQVKETVFFHFILFRKLFYLFCRSAAGQKIFFIHPHAGADGKAGTADAGRRRRSQSQVVRKFPVFPVMPGAVSFPGKAGYFIPFKAVMRKDAAHILVHGPAFLFGRPWKLSFVCQLGKAGALFQDKAVHGHMGNGQVHCPEKRFSEIHDALPRQFIHEIYTDITKSQVPGPLHRLFRLRSGVKTAD